MATEKEQWGKGSSQTQVQTHKRSYSIRPRTQNNDYKNNYCNRSTGMTPSAQRTKRDSRRNTPVRIIPLGGLNEIGKNMTVFECCNDMFILDCGLAFPDMDMPGVDLVIPNFSYVEANKERLRGIVITHGHEDHIGGLVYFLKKVNVPVYGTRMTIGLIKRKLEEHGILKQCKLVEVEPRKTVRMGCMAVEFINVNHSIPGAVGMAIHTPAGILVHTGDFKVDFSPIDGEIIDLARFGELGSRGVLALMADSTNAEQGGFTKSERTIGDSFEKLFKRAEGKRIIIATFSSNVHRVQQIIDQAQHYDRKVAVFGRSMVHVMETAQELGYLKVPKDMIIDIEDMERYPDEKIVLITTGSQGEPLSALTRMAMNSHKKVSITPNDFIIISAKPIPGNEKYVTRVVNELMKTGAEVIYESMYEVHVSGHACQEELKLIHALTKPKFFIPMHGEYKHLVKHAEIAKSMGMPEENILIASIGDVIETNGQTMRIVSQVPAGRVMVDGLGVGDVGSIVLRDRKHLAQDGLIIVVIAIDRMANAIVSGPDIISRGFVYVRESEELMEEAREILNKTLSRCSNHDLKEWGTLKTKLRDVLSDFIYEKTKRSPMILPIIMKI
ncbi:MAG: ribonuclease J [Ruminococcus sp.]|nr:ribonuclease J [Ruminococcus sp.]